MLTAVQVVTLGQKSGVHAWLSDPCHLDNRLPDVQGHMPSPACCTFDPIGSMIGLASLGSGKADAVSLTLWQLTEGGEPTLVGQHGRPAKQGLFRRPKQAAQPWALSLDAEARACLVAVPGSQLHLFQWQVCPRTHDHCFVTWLQG